MRASPLIAALLLCGCSGHANVRLASGQVSAPQGTSVTRSSLSVGVRTNNVAAALVVLNALGIATHFSREDHGWGTIFRANPLRAVEPGAPSEPSDAPHRVHEQDCTQPIQDPSANLRCR